MKKIFFVFLISYSAISCGQTKRLLEQNYDSCVNKNINIIKVELDSIFGKQWVDENINKHSRIRFVITLDSLGSVVSLDGYKADMLSKEQFILFFSKIREKKFCLINGDSHLSYNEFIKFGKNRYQYTYIYPMGK